MSAYEICYDLQAPGQKYDRLIEKIKSYGIWCHLQQSVWVVSTTQSAKETGCGVATFRCRVKLQVQWTVRNLSPRTTVLHTRFTDHRIHILWKIFVEIRRGQNKWL